MLNRSLACVRDQNLAEENDIFEEEKETQRKENVNLLRRQKELELEVEHLKGELQVCEHYYYFFLNASFFAGCRCVSWCFCLVVSSGCSSRLCSAVWNTTGSHWLDRLGFPQCRACWQCCHMHCGPGCTLTPLGVRSSLLLHLVQFELWVLHFVIKNMLCF